MEIHEKQTLQETISQLQNELHTLNDHWKRELSQTIDNVRVFS